jgi:hypothetical protein
MKIRHDTLAVSSVLFTLALLTLAPAALDFARTTHQSRLQDITMHVQASNADQIVIPNFSAPIGFACLAIIGIGLMVTWAGYFKGVRWTWYVMFVIVWLWAFPLCILPYFYPWRYTDSAVQTFVNTIRDSLDPGPDGWLARAFLKVSTAFLFMVVALILPVKTFIRGQGGNLGKSGRANSGPSDKPNVSVV